MVLCGLARCKKILHRLTWFKNMAFLFSSWKHFFFGVCANVLVPCLSFNFLFLPQNSNSVMFHHEITIIITQEPWQETECPGHDSWVMWNYLDNIFWAKVLRHFLHGTSLFFWVTFHATVGVWFPELPWVLLGVRALCCTRMQARHHQDFDTNLCIYIRIYNIYRYIYIYLYFHKTKTGSRLLEAHIPKEFLALPWGLLLSFDDGALMESWTGRF